MNFMIFNPKASLVPEKMSYIRSFAKSCHYRWAISPVDCCVLYGIDLPHCLSKLRRHEAIEDEVGGAVGEGNHVHHLSHWVVAL